MKYSIIYLIFCCIFFGCTADLNHDEKELRYGQLILSADSAFKLKKYELAIKYATNAIEICDTLSQGYVKRGEAFIGLKQYDDAKDDFSDAIEIEGEKSPVVKLRANAYYLNDEKSNFLDDINSYIRHNEKDADAFSRRANYYLGENELEKAIADYSSAIEINPKNYICYLKRANLYAINDQPSLSIKDYESYLFLNPKRNNDQVIYNKGLLHMRINNFQKALSDFSQISNPLFTVDLFVLKGDCYFNLKNYVNAISYYSKHLISNPNDYEVLKKRGNSFIKIKNLKRANSDFKKSESIKWESKGFSYRYGWYTILIVAYFSIGIILFATLKEEYDNKRYSTCYLYFSVFALFGGHYVYTNSIKRYILHTITLFAIIFLNAFNLRSFYDRPDHIITEIKNSMPTMYIIYFLLSLLLIDLLLIPYYIFSKNYAFRASINEKTSKVRSEEIYNLEKLLNRQNIEFKALK